MSDDAKQDVWAICELMGHVKFAGRLIEQEMGSGKLFRCDIPDGDGFVTRLFGPAAVYSISFVTEDVARHIQKRQGSAAPVQSWDFPKALPAPPEAAGLPPKFTDDPAAGFEPNELPRW